MGRRTRRRTRRIRLAVLLASLAVVVLGAVAIGRSFFKTGPEEYVRRGHEYFDQGQFPEAILEYRRALQLDQQLGDARLKLGDAYARTNDPGNAIKEYIRAADLLPDNTDAQLKAAGGLLLAGRFEDARTRADKVLEKDAQNASAQILRGNALAGLKDFDGAVADYENAIASNPAQHEAFVNLGTIQQLRGNKDQAEAAFLKAVEAAPKLVQARLALANFYWAGNRPVDA